MGADTFDSQTFQDGLYISLLGMGIVLAVLVLLALVIMVLDRLDLVFPAEALPAAGVPASSAPRPAPTRPARLSQEAGPDAQTAAAIGVALALAELEAAPRRAVARPVTPVAASVSNSGSWVAAGRARQMRGWAPGTARERQR